MSEELTAQAKMLIRRPVAEVFEAWVDPAVMSKFWFPFGSARLDAGKPVTWRVDTPNGAIDFEIRVVEVRPNERIVIGWDGAAGSTTVTWTFTPRGADATFVHIVERGFGGSRDQQVAQAIDSTGGFNLVIAAAKAYLEHGVRLNVVDDHWPDAS